MSRITSGAGSPFVPRLTSPEAGGKSPQPFDFGDGIGLKGPRQPASFAHWRVSPWEKQRDGWSTHVRHAERPPGRHIRDAHPTRRIVGERRRGGVARGSRGAARGRCGAAGGQGLHRRGQAARGRRASPALGHPRARWSSRWCTIILSKCSARARSPSTSRPRRRSRCCSSACRVRARPRLRRSSACGSRTKTKRRS